MLTRCHIRSFFVLNRFFLPIFYASLLLSAGGCDRVQEATENAIADTKISDPSLCQFATGSCRKNLDGVELQLALSPVDAPSERPLQLSLTASEPITSVQVRLEGRDMFMGIIPVKLKQVSGTQYSADVIYGSCSSGYMVWSAFISFDYRGKMHTLVFDFLADNDA
ncbi:hypothetical protein [Shewanella salipaludis]|uniref:Lipoprotein n=1 Tax=Shewanella salipaludis TaxID=2723052 RepID=A0A972G3V2_9GAMM|nr:hypothetical protein [Shewanella salipaludis]NMH63945.1 hypothetical protein [Shewanella salipaludis]